MFIIFLMNWNHVSFFPIVGKNTCSKWVVESQCKWMSYRVCTNFNHLNWNPIMTIALVTSKSLISFITSLLPAQRVWIWSFVIYDWNRRALFWKKRVKNISFFLKIRDKFITNKQWRHDRKFCTIVKSFQYRPIDFIT